jgi:RNA polymerase sigma-70 factor (ECF subfamily)
MRRAAAKRRIMDSGDTIELWNLYRHTGDQQAARDLFNRYAERLIKLVRTRLSEKLARRLDPEDVVQSVFKSIFTGAREVRDDQERYILEHSGDLWRLLAAITLNKLRSQVEYHSADKRAMAKEDSCEIAGGVSALEAQLQSMVSPSGEVALAEEVEIITRDLDPIAREVFEMRLQGYTLQEIADRSQRSVRTVRRLLDQIKHRLERKCRDAVA